MVSTSSLKDCKKLKISLSKCLEHSFLISRSLQNYFLKSFLWPTWNFIRLESSLSLSQKWFQFRHSKICEKLKNVFFKRSEHSFLSSRSLQNHFLRNFLWPNFDLNSFEHFVWLFQEMVSTSSIKNLKKTKKWNFQTSTILVLELKEASKPFS